MKRFRSLRAALSLLAAFAVAAWSAPAAFAAAPENVTKPTVEGQAREGQVLTARDGTWQNAPTSFRYQWQRCDASGSACVNIAGQVQRTYTLDADDVGRTLRVVVSAVNDDGTGSAASAVTAVVSSSSPPRNTARPTISGAARTGEELTADPGEWSGGPERFAYQWQRCDADGSGCVDVAGATGKAYGVRSADLKHRLRVAVEASNGVGSATATSDVSDPVVSSAPTPNQRPSIELLSARMLGARVYARFRVCDDSSKNLTVIQTDSRPGVAAQTRRFSTLRPALKCGLYSRTWLPAPRFRGEGRYVVTLRVRDASGLTSFAVRRVFL